MSLATSIIAVTFSGGALIVAALGYRRAGRAVEVSRAANRLSEESNGLSRQALDWQRDRDASRTRTTVRVEVNQGAEASGFFVMVAGDHDPRPDPIYYYLQLDVINDGETTEWLTGLYVQQPDGQGDQGYDLTNHLPGGQDFELAPRKRFSAKASPSEFGFDLTDGFVAWARLASGAAIYSEVMQPDQGVLDHVAEHNRGARHNPSPGPHGPMGEWS